MSKISLTVLLAASLIVFSSFFAAKGDLVGTWRWVHIINTQSGETMDIEKGTMGMTKEVKTELKADDTYAEHKLRKEDDKVSTTTGTWKLEAEGTVLNLSTGEKERPARIIRLSGDTLTIAMRGHMQLVMVKEK
ncbi:MAG TPA: lipocalin family protein [Chitinophagaceae bacterium]|nr:lipocalin family protein [Chitinophagaceae bacterium]